MKRLTSKFTGKRALIAEDYFVNQEVIQNILELMELHVDIAENGLEALDKHEVHEYDIIFMDVQMPELDGYQTTQEIRKREGARKHTPIVALTANALTGDKEKCLDAGMDDYITKPVVDANWLEELLNRYL